MNETVIQLVSLGADAIVLLMVHNVMEFFKDFLNTRFPELEKRIKDVEVAQFDLKVMHQKLNTIEAMLKAVTQFKIIEAET